jgi:hypothetical protein
MTEASFLQGKNTVNIYYLKINHEPPKTRKTHLMNRKVQYESTLTRKTNEDHLSTYLSN